MDGIWTLLMHLGLCFAVPGLTQDSSRTLFLISGPVELHAGTPTLLSVIVIADSPGRVTAELVQGNIRVTQTLNFQRGLTTVLTLPPIPGSVAQDSLFNLTVRGYSNNGLIFTNTTTLGVNLKNISTLIQTDRSCYQPGYNVNKTVVVQLRQKIFQLKFKDFPTTLKPSLYFSTKLRISRYDRKPLASGDLMHSAVVEVTQRPSTLNSSTTLTLQVPEDGKVHIKFKLRDQIETVFIRARFQSSEETLTVYNNYSSPSGSYIQISPSNTLYGQVSLSWSSNEAQPGEQVSLSVTTPEPRSQVGIVIMGMDDETLEDDQDLQVEQHCSLKTLTNAGLYKENQPDGAKNGFSKTQNKETYWSHWMNFNDSLLWLDTNVSDAKWMSGKITVPDGVTSLRAVALVMSDNLGLGFTQVPQKLTVSKDFSLSLNVPSYLIRGEEIVLEVNIINHLEQELEVIVLLTQNKAFKFVLENRENVSVKHAQKLNLRSHVSGSALFPIRPVALGEIEITVDAVSAEASDRLVWRVLVKMMSLGDILGLSINNLESLVEMPLGCGEQNMIHIAPSIYVLQYLDKSTLDNQEIRTWALNFMREGYVKQLSYQRDDGSFSAFGASDTSGSTWLTAFVLRCFIQAQNYIQVDENVLTGAMTWLLKRQGPQGEFSEVGRLIHTEMQGGLDNGPVALTAYVLIALLEDGTYVGTYQGNVSLALSYLESKVSSGVVSNYSLCLVTYALTLANSPLAEFALAELNRRADHRDGEMMWRSSAGLESNEWDVHSAQIEMVSYVLLVLFRRGSLVEGIALLKWLSNQRNHLGGYTTTQDTVVALQALAYYAAFSGANAIDLRLNITSPGSNLVSLFSINSTTYRMYQRQELEKSEVCIDFPVIRNYKVARVEDAVVQVYDYYEPNICPVEVSIKLLNLFQPPALNVTFDLFGDMGGQMSFSLIFNFTETKTTGHMKPCAPDTHLGHLDAAGY
ncbi:CD109 antigen 150 kDa TGF-beta-1-binding protein [Channa argus]|uniref:CD109 antigen 150 kDa TGF-beta-1-binding protein n=1 Tax=Channa argus TaxID=215402 RepID=A0A6G1QFZ3_CHAAH|nr:CD109 antigen 150 kDa TGF-beta-1-binding protein [Channa argus]